MNHFPLRIILCLAALTLLGCGSEHPPTGKVTGRVTVAGQPVAQGKILFYPAQGRPAMGTLQPDGAYALTTFEPGDGALLGPHQVTILATESTGGQMPQSFEEELASGSGTPGTLTWLVPPAYSQRDTTPLTAEVKAGKNEIDFEIPQP